MRPYERSHPWLKFELDLQRAPPRLWMALGEAQSKCYHIAGVPLLPELAESLHQIFLAKGALATTAIEGNTLSEEQVRKRIEGTLKLPPSKEYLGVEIDNVVAALNEILRDVISAKSADISSAELKHFNRTVLQGLPLEAGVVPGHVSDHGVTVGRYRGAPREDCEYLLDRLCNWLSGEEFRAPKGDEIVYAIVRAIVAHIYIAWIHPFGDGNGRTARLAEFKILLAAGVPSPAAHLLSNHYNQTRIEYYRRLDQASGSGGDLIPFVQYAVGGLVDGLKEQVEWIRVHQWELAWQHHVHESFRDRHGSTDTRRRHLVLDLSAFSDPVPLSKIRELSPRIAQAYASKTTKTIKRDLNALVAMKLIEQVKGGYQTRKGSILQFLPRSGRPLPLFRDEDTSTS